MSGVRYTRRRQYPMPQRSSQDHREAPSASRPPSEHDISFTASEIYANQLDEYADYHEECRIALWEQFGENPDMGWNYIDRLRRIFEAGNSVESVLSAEMRVKLTTNRITNALIAKLARRYDDFPRQVADNFEIPNIEHEVVERSTNPTPRRASRGEPRPSGRIGTHIPSPSPFEASARILNSLVEPAEGEYRLNRPIIASNWGNFEEPESPLFRRNTRFEAPQMSPMGQYMASVEPRSTPRRRVVIESPLEYSRFANTTLSAPGTGRQRISLVSPRARVQNTPVTSPTLRTTSLPPTTSGPPISSTPVLQPPQPPTTL